DPVPHRRAPGVVGQAQPAHHPVRAEEPLRQDRQGQPLPQRHPRRGRRGGRQDRHFPGRTLPAAGQEDPPAPGPGRPPPLHPAPPWHSSAPCERPPPPGLDTWPPPTTPAAPAPSARHAATSASSKPSATPSP